MSKVNIKTKPKQQAKTMVKNLVKVIDSPDLINEIEYLKKELEKSDELLDQNFKIMREEEDRISELRERNKVLSKKMIEKDKIQIEEKADEIEDIIEKSELMLKQINKRTLRAESNSIPQVIPKVIPKIITKPVITPVRKIQPLVRKSVPTIIKK